jgi:hypothetical protein
VTRLSWDELDAFARDLGRPTDPETMYRPPAALHPYASRAEAAADAVNPEHYKVGGIEYWDFAEAKGLTENAYLFNAGKYIVRCGKKEGADPIQDLEKAIKFIQRDIDRRKRADGRMARRPDVPTEQQEQPR